MPIPKVPMSFPFDNSYARLPQEFFSVAEPTPVREPTLVRLNRDLARQLGLDTEWLESEQGLATLAGNHIAAGAQPLAMAYSGHQFGGFSPQLGDGRAILLGEVVSSDGTRYDIQLKGSGPTPFSRRGDGRSALGPVLREYIVSEAMAALGVPTTRALAAVASGELVLRCGYVPGGIFTRVAKSHLRIGTFQWFAARQDKENLRILADYAIDRHYPQAREAENPYLALLDGVIERQAGLIAHWMQFGFIHGVMNTDNMSISGETIDYGPCAFMDEYHPLKVFSSIDSEGRYAFTNQSSIGHWNLTRFAETLLPLMDEDEERSIPMARRALERYPAIHRRALQSRFAAKLGIADQHAFVDGDSNHPDWQLVESLLAAMADSQADFTLFFRYLSDAFESGDDSQVIELFEEISSIKPWLVQWRDRHRTSDPQQVVDLMRRSNPVFIPRNHRIEEVIKAADQGDYEPFHRMNQLLRDPYKPQSEFAEYEKPPEPGEVVQATFCGT